MKTGAAAIPTTRARAIYFLALTKPRLNVLVVVTTGVGYCLGVRGQFEAVTLLHTLIGSALVAGGAAALNQLAERDIDGTMERTRRRPIPTGRVQPWEALIFAGLLTGLGLTELTYWHQCRGQRGGAGHTGQLRRRLHPAQAPYAMVDTDWSGGRARSHPSSAGRPRVALSALRHGCCLGFSFSGSFRTSMRCRGCIGRTFGKPTCR